MPNNIQSYLKVYDTLFPQKKFVYMSLPITTGPAFINWFNETGKHLDTDSDEYKLLHRQSVIERNIKSSKQLAENIYKRLNNDKYLLINPAELDVPFTQAEYMVFWTDFIKHRVDQIIFVDGWATSNGSIMEYIVARGNKIPCFDFQLNQMDDQYAVGFIKNARDYLNDIGFKSDIQDQMLRLLNNESPEVRV